MQPSILIVDDQKETRDTLARYLSTDYEIHTASNGSDAMQKIRENSKIELVLSDVDMPEMDGMELLEQIMASRNTVPTIFITGSPIEGLAVNALQKGAYDFMTKPVDLFRLGASIKSAIHEISVDA